MLLVDIRYFMYVDIMHVVMKKMHTNETESSEMKHLKVLVALERNLFTSVHILLKYFVSNTWPLNTILKWKNVLCYTSAYLTWQLLVKLRNDLMRWDIWLWWKVNCSITVVKVQCWCLSVRGTSTALTNVHDGWMSVLALPDQSGLWYFVLILSANSNI